MSAVLKALVVACCFAVGFGTFNSNIDERFSKRRSRRESGKKTIVIYNGYVPVEDHLECVPSGNVVQMLRCNGVAQLPGGTDETNCSSTRAGRRPGSFKCLNGQEIWDLWRCDGYRHCEDGSDETDCEDYGTRPAKDLFYLCNGVEECRGGWDEVNCPPDYTPDVELIPPSFTCSNQRDSRALTVRFKCDGQTDCKDGSDEWNCEKKFRCKNNEKTLLPVNEYCDGKTFCGSQQEDPSCILVNGPSNHVLKNVSQSDTVEIYEYVIDQDPSSEETDSYSVTFEENSDPEPEHTDLNLSSEHGNAHSQRKEHDEETSNSQPELTLPTNTHQSTTPLQQQSNDNNDDKGEDHNSDDTGDEEDRNTAANNENGNKDNIQGIFTSMSGNIVDDENSNNNDDYEEKFPDERDNADSATGINDTWGSGDIDDENSNNSDDNEEVFEEEHDDTYSGTGDNDISVAGPSAAHLHHLSVVVSLILLNIT